MILSQFLLRIFIAVMFLVRASDGFAISHGPLLPSLRRSGGQPCPIVCHEGKRSNSDETLAEPHEDRRNFVKAALVTCGGLQNFIGRGQVSSANAVGLGETFASYGGWELLKDGSVIGRLKRCGSSYCVSYLVDGSLFTGVVDTGSPFITVTGSCSKQWGCYRGQGRQSGLSDTYEIFAGSEGRVRWRTSEVWLPPPVRPGGGKGPELESVLDLGKGSGMVFGVLSKDLEGFVGPGGVFLGLVKARQTDIRPTFLGQAGFAAFSCDLRRPPPTKDLPPGSLPPRGKSLLLSTKPLIPKGTPNAVKLIDLTPFGDPVKHYACTVSRLTVNGLITGGTGSSLSQEIASKPVFAIFDTGSTGLGISRELFTALFEQQVSSETRVPWDQVTIQVPTEGGGTVDYGARRPLTFGIDIPWPNFDGHLIVLGLSFLDRGKLTVDVDDERLLLEQAEDAAVKGGVRGGRSAWAY